MVKIMRMVRPIYSLKVKAKEIGTLNFDARYLARIQVRHEWELVVLSDMYVIRSASTSLDPFANRFQKPGEALILPLMVPRPQPAVFYEKLGFTRELLEIRRRPAVCEKKRAVALEPSPNLQQRLESTRALMRNQDVQNVRHARSLTCGLPAATRAGLLRWPTLGRSSRQR